MKAPDENNLGKLKRAFKYFNETFSIKFMLTADKLEIFEWYIDASKAIHDD